MSRRARITGPLNKHDLATAVAAELGVSHDDASRAIHAVLNVITRTIAGGHEVRITNFGSWRPVWAPERQARNPRTGAPVTVPGQMVPRFTAYDRFRDVVRAGDPAAATIGKRPNNKEITA